MKFSSIILIFKEIRIVLIREKIETKKDYFLNKEKGSKYHKKLETIKDSELKKKLKSLISAYDKKNS